MKTANCTKPAERRGFPGGASGKEPACQFKRHKSHRSTPGSGRSPGDSTWQSALVFLPGKSRGQRNLVGSGSKSRMQLK